MKLRNILKNYSQDVIEEVINIIDYRMIDDQDYVKRHIDKIGEIYWAKKDTI